MTSHVYTYRITLTSDAEPGTGLGGEVLNEIVPRDAWGRPMLDGAHIKGLMSQALREMADQLWHPAILRSVFGEPGILGLAGGSQLRVGPAVAPRETPIRTVTRTAVGETGTALDRTLRTTEVIPVGTVFEGVIETPLEPNTPIDLAWRLALLALPAVGGGRQRGCGLCVASIVGPVEEKRSPGQLLRALHEHLRANENQFKQPVAPAPAPTTWAFQGQAATLRLIFEADSPICCPEVTTQSNVIESGFSIPASAVQGMLLTHLNARDPALATALHESDLFRAWPLQPCDWDPQGREARSGGGPRPAAIRVSLTHRAAKFSLPEMKEKASNGDEGCPFQDESIERYDWTQTVNGSPLKASDGVLLYGTGDGEIRLWKAGQIPRVVTAHGVHHSPVSKKGSKPNDDGGGRNLFTMNAMAPLVWQGLVSVPAEAVPTILQTLSENPRVAVGKSRSVRGFGRLVAAVEPAIPLEWQVVEHARPDDDEREPKVTLFVVQSPLRIPHDSMQDVDATTALRTLATNWAKKHELPDCLDAWPNAGIRFGWNRLDKKRLPACYVILPGSVFALPAGLDPQKVAAAIRAGIGEKQDRQRGFGAVVVHPGKATGDYDLQARSSHRTVLTGDSQRRQVVAQVLEWAETGRKLPSASQIRAVQQRLERAGVRATIDFLEKQKVRPARIWGAWEPIHDPLIRMIQTHEKRPELVCQALEVLADLSLAAKGEETR